MSTKPKKSHAESTLPPEALTCGIIMPIGPIDGCSAEHWSEVKNIMMESVDLIESPKFSANLVSDAEDSGVIHKRIVQNIYKSDIIVCDVSGKNPNVMFELGMRLAFDKPTIIVKDEKTDYSFDTGIIEHISYPRDLRFSKIVNFKKTLAAKIEATHRAAISSEHSTFLKNFGEFQIAKIAESEVSPDRLILSMLADIQGEVARLRTQTGRQIDNTIVSGLTERARIHSKRRLFCRKIINDHIRENPEMEIKELMNNLSFQVKLLRLFQNNGNELFNDIEHLKTTMSRVLSEWNEESASDIFTLIA